jgi:hypothetical protein
MTTNQQQLAQTNHLEDLEGACPSYGPPGVFTVLDSGVVYCCKERCCGSMPKDYYEDVPGYDARARLYPTLIPVVRPLLDQLRQERVNVEHWKRVAARRGAPFELQAHVLHCEWAAARRERAVEKLLDVLWLSEGNQDL